MIVRATGMKRAWTGALLLAALLSFPRSANGGAPAPISAPAYEPSPLDLATTDVAALQAAMAHGTLTSEALVRYLLDRIERLDDAGPGLHAVLEVSPRALGDALALDTERRESGIRGPLHGIPVLVKGNIDVAGMPNTAGSLALAANVPERDAFLVARLREAGAVILATANLSEWANFRSSRSSSGWSSVGRQTRNPYVLDRSPCGSSSGSAVAVAAGLAVLAVGTETDGSVVCPAGQNGVVGIKPTLGLVSRQGIVPIAHSQDTAGAMGRTVRDAALLLSAMVGRDPEDPAAGDFPEEVPHFLSGLGTGGRLDGIRIGVWRDHFGAGRDPDVEGCLAAAVSSLEGLGAEVVDPVEMGELEGLSEAEDTVLYTEFKVDVARYLEARGDPGGMASLADLIAFDQRHAESVMPYFGQEIFERAQEQGPLTGEDYLEALATAHRVARGAIDGALDEAGLDAILAPTNSPAWPIDLVNGDAFYLSSSQLPAVSGYPNVTVPMCFVHQLPVGLSVFGAALSEPELLRIAGAFEEATRARRAPHFLPTLKLE